MFEQQKAYGTDPSVVVRTKTWGQPLAWERAAAQANRYEHVFTCSWSDWFHVDADVWRPEAWSIVKRCPHLIFQILTKRHDRIADHLPPDWGDGYHNCWIGVSVENQRWADERIPYLLRVPAVVRFVSYEPALAYVDFSGYLGPDKISWLIQGGESGPDYRPMDMQWARDVREQCRRAGTAYFFKQSAARYTEMGIELDGQIVREYPSPPMPPPDSEAFTLT